MSFYKIDSKKYDLANVDACTYDAFMTNMKAKTTSSEWLYLRGRIPNFLQYRKDEPLDVICADLLKSRALGKGITEEKLCLQYGSVIGADRYSAYVLKQSETNTFEYKNKKYGMTREEFDKYNASRACTKDNFIMRHGAELGSKKWDEYRNLQKYVGSSEQYFKDKYGETQGTEKWVALNAAKALTLDNFVKKYGDEEGEARYFAAMENTYAYHHNKSKIATSFVLDLCEELGVDDYYGGDKAEFSIYDHETKRIYFYDFKVRGSKRVVEFHGDYWHANPSKYDKDAEIKYPTGIKTSAEVWDHDAMKLNAAKRAGYEVDIVWQSCYNENPTLEVKRVAAWIKS